MGTGHWDIDKKPSKWLPGIKVSQIVAYLGGEKYSKTENFLLGMDVRLTIKAYLG
jgi:hypothetical protein